MPVSPHEIAAIEGPKANASGALAPYVEHDSKHSLKGDPDHGLKVMEFKYGR
jgi:hypothetical protein